MFVVSIVSPAIKSLLKVGKLFIRLIFLSMVNAFMKKRKEKWKIVIDQPRINHENIKVDEEHCLWTYNIISKPLESINKVDYM